MVVPIKFYYYPPTTMSHKESERICPFFCSICGVVHEVEDFHFRNLAEAYKAVQKTAGESNNFQKLMATNPKAAAHPGAKEVEKQLMAAAKVANVKHAELARR